MIHDNKQEPAVDPIALELRDQYLARRRADITMMTNALEENELNTLRVAGHNMAGSGPAYGFDRIGQIGAGIEQAASALERDTLATLIAELEDFLDALDAGDAST